jgi:hypothetical protein
MLLPGHLVSDAQLAEELSRSDMPTPDSSCCRCHSFAARPRRVYRVIGGVYDVETVG